MPVILSLYLDLVRFLAAAGVLFEHISSKPITSGVFWWRLGNYGAVGVIIFFVLSGYVIAYVLSTRENSIGPYFSNRISRLYSVALPALILTFTLDSVGIFINPDFYQMKAVLWRPESWSGYISSMFFLNEYQIFDFGGISPGTNGPYWSLSFEATYYLVAGVAIFLPLVRSLPVVAIILVIAGKTIAALLPVWMLGYFLYKSASKLKLKAFTATAGFFLSAFLLVLHPSIVDQLPSDNFGFYFPWGRAAYNRNLVADYVVAILFGVHVLSAQNIAQRFGERNYSCAAAIRWIGGLTFPLYCIHYPVLCFLRAVSPWGMDTWENAFFLLILMSLSVVLVGSYCDNLKMKFRYNFHKFKAN